MSSLLLCLFSFGVQAQQFDYHRDFQQILAQSQDSNSLLYYPRLLQRFTQNDSTLTDAEVLALQIGHTVSEYYYPYQLLKEERRIKQLVIAGKWEQALAACNKLLIQNPLNLTALSEKLFVSRKLGLDSLPSYRLQQQKLISAILYSGDGSAQRPFFVLGPQDGQHLIVQVLGGTVGAMASLTDPNDYFLDVLELQKAGKEPVMLHFNIAHAHARMFTEEDKAEILKALEGDDVLTKTKKKNKD